MNSANIAAKYFLALADEDSGDLISNLKLQKLLYFAQGLHLAAFDAPLFQERIEAWLHGPVVPDIYRQYSKHRGDPIPSPDDGVPMLDEETESFLNEIYRLYGQYSAWKLRQMTHETTPWVKGRQRPDQLITHNAMKEYFVTLIEDA